MAIEEAIFFAAQAHAGQTRKGKSTPYIAHPFAVAAYLMQAGADETTVVAGLLHDYLEDAPGEPTQKRQVLAERFGDDVLRLVDIESEDKTQPWETRKLTTVRALQTTDDKRILLIACADKAANLHEMRRDYEVVGEELWQRFNRDKDHIAWYYRAVIDALAVKPAIVSLAMFAQLKEDYSALFEDER